MRWISAGVCAVALGNVWTCVQAQEPTRLDDSVVQALGKPDAAPLAEKKPMSEAEAQIAAVDQKLNALKAIEAKAKAASEKDRDKAAEARLAELRGVLEQRKHLLAQWETVVKDRAAAERPPVTPEAEAAELKAAADRDRATLARAEKDPNSLLPEVFRSPMVTEAAMAEMTVAIERAQGVFDDSKKAVESLVGVTGTKSANPLAKVRADRDDIRKRMSTIAPRAAETETAISVAPNAEARELAKEKLENLEWERKIEGERLREAEAHIDLETRRAAHAEVQLDAKKIKLDLARVTLTALQSRYTERVTQQVAALKKESAIEAVRAEATKDPLERYRAQRTKELLDQKALLEERDNEWKTTPSVSLQEQTDKAISAKAHFEELKKTVREARSADTVAQRLNNSYRKLATERAALVRNELAKVVASIDHFERELTEIESTELDDLQGDRAFRETLLSVLAPGRRAAAVTMFDSFERQKSELLTHRKRVLRGLTERAEKTQEQILLRVALMDEAHAFIRTHLFWVRDQPPLGLTAMDQGRKDARDVIKTLIGMMGEPWIRAHWTPVLPEFLLVFVALFVLPLVLYRVRKALRLRLKLAKSGRVEPTT